MVVIICSLFVQLSNFARAQYLMSYTQTLSRIAVFTLLGVLYFSYPFLGFLADVKFTRYRILVFSFAILAVGEILGLLVTIIDVIFHTVFYSSENFAQHLSSRFLFIAVISAILFIIGIGLFEANAIQFGLDQLLEAPTPKLITFIHWYYWSQNVGHIAVFYAAVGWLSIGNCTLKQSILRHDILENILVSVLMISFVFLALVNLTLFCIKKKHFYIQRAGLNPFKNIYRVLKYAWKHKVPEHRSAFTYWEEDIPPRIDLGKDKYGGPFTTEEVEDTKTFLRILPLLLCLFGYHLAGDGYSAPEQLLRTSCPSLPVLLLIVANPLHMSTLVTVVGIPLYRLVIMKLVPRIKNVQMLTKMWIGLYLSLLQVVLYIIVVVNHDTRYWLQRQIPVLLPSHGPTSICYCIRTGYNSKHCNQSVNNNEPVDNTYLWFIIPQLLNGLSSLLVSMTVFEFICAQAPRTMQGLFIGLWYATFSIRYLVGGVLDNLITERRSWLICEGVKGFLILVSLVLFSCVSRHYRYRQRDEIVNVQGMIEDTHEKWIQQEKEYMQEQKLLLGNNNIYTIQ